MLLLLGPPHAPRSYWVRLNMRSLVYTPANRLGNFCSLVLWRVGANMQQHPAGDPLPTPLPAGAQPHTASTDLRLLLSPHARVVHEIHALHLPPICGGGPTEWQAGSRTRVRAPLLEGLGAGRARGQGSQRGMQAGRRQQPGRGQRHAPAAHPGSAFARSSR